MKKLMYKLSDWGTVFYETQWWSQQWWRWAPPCLLPPPPQFGDPVKFALQRLMNIWIPFRDASRRKSRSPVFNKSNLLGITNQNWQFWTNQNQLCIRNSWTELWAIFLWQLGRLTNGGFIINLGQTCIKKNHGIKNIWQFHHNKISKFKQWERERFEKKL